MPKAMNIETQTDIAVHLLHGNGIRSTSTLVGCSTDSTQKTLGRLGSGCELLHDMFVRDMPSQKIQMDELWGFVGSKKSKVWTAVSIDVPSRAIISIETGPRDADLIEALVRDTRARTVGRPMITTDGMASYITAIEKYFGADVVHGLVVKETSGRRLKRITRFLADGSGAESLQTSYVERLNLSIRQEISRAGRKTLRHSKKLEYHRAAIWLWAMNYNFCRIHTTLRVTPAMEAGLATECWTIQELVERALNAKSSSPLPEVHQQRISGRPVVYRSGFGERLEGVFEDVEAGLAYLSTTIREIRQIDDLKKFKRRSKGPEPMRSTVVHTPARDVELYFVQKKGGQVEMSDIIPIGDEKPSMKKKKRKGKKTK